MMRGQSVSSSLKYLKKKLKIEGCIVTVALNGRVAGWFSFFDLIFLKSDNFLKNFKKPIRPTIDIWQLSY